MKILKILLECSALIGFIRLDVVSSMSALPPTQSFSETKSSVTEDPLAKQKEIIDDLIPKLLNDPSEKPRTYNENNVRNLFSVLLENQNASLCSYVEDEFVCYYINDKFALECGLITTVQETQYAKFCPFLVSSSHFMEKFAYYFRTTKTRLLSLQQLDSERKNSD